MEARRAAFLRLERKTGSEEDQAPRRDKQRQAAATVLKALKAKETEHIASRPLKRFSSKLLVVVVVHTYLPKKKVETNKRMMVVMDDQLKHDKLLLWLQRARRCHLPRAAPSPTLFPQVRRRRLLRAAPVLAFFSQVAGIEEKKQLTLEFVSHQGTSHNITDRLSYQGWLDSMWAVHPPTLHVYDYEFLVEQALDRTQEIRNIFDEYDTDKSGHISQEPRQTTYYLLLTTDY